MAVTFTRVQDVMQREIKMISGLASVGEAIAVMRANQVTSLVIERRHEGDEYGFISVEQIAARVVAKNRSLVRTSVYEVMDKPALTLDAHMAVRYAIRLLAQLGHRRALVVDEGGARGLVNLRDLVLGYEETGEPDRDGVEGAG